jgi:hypothetical protein
MSLLGTHLTLLIGPTVPVPVPRTFLDALDSLEISHSDEGRSGFQMLFKMGRSSKSLIDFPLLSSPLLKPPARVIIVLTVGVLPRVLMDGIITNQQLAPGTGSNPTTLTVTGEDVSVMMDREEKNVEHPAQSEMIIAAKIIATYAQFGLIPAVIPPPSLDIPLPTERTPVQRATDLSYLQELAARFDYAFYVTPGPAPGMNTAYWGPKVRIGLPQKALSVDMGAMTNVDSINFQNNATDATTVTGNVQDRDSNQATPVQTNTSTRPPLAAEPALNQPNVARQVRFNPDGGLNSTQAMSQAQAITDASTDTVSADGELNAARYGDILQARGLVGLRGVGYSYDGLYYVKKVTHKIKRGEYKQSFSLTREGLGATVPMVRP